MAARTPYSGVVLAGGFSVNLENKEPQPGSGCTGEAGAAREENFERKRGDGAVPEQCSTIISWTISAPGEYHRGPQKKPGALSKPPYLFGNFRVKVRK